MVCLDDKWESLLEEDVAKNELSDVEFQEILIKNNIKVDQKEKYQEDAVPLPLAVHGGRRADDGDE